MTKKIPVMLVTLVTLEFQALQICAHIRENNLSNYGNVGNLSDIAIKTYYDSLKISQ